MEFIFIILMSWLIIAVALKLTRPKAQDASGDDEESFSSPAMRPLAVTEEVSSPSVAMPASPYHYSRRRYLMTQAENSFFKLLTQAVGTHANVFPQVRLSALLYRTKGIEGRFWRAALARINQKSVDYVLCDKITGEILLVIELDDITHDTTIRQKRDAGVNEMLEEAGVPFVRFRNVSGLTKNAIVTEIYEIVPMIFKNVDSPTEAQSIYR